MAKSLEAYTHRIGRTGRAGKKGAAITFLGKYDTEIMFDFRIMLEKSGNSVIPQGLLRHEVLFRLNLGCSTKAETTGSDHSKINAKSIGHR
jgi:superfamily II DNA/RNA helicase